jgi:hypothetical protein
MIDYKAAVSAIVTAYKGIPALVTAMTDSSASINIFGYQDSYPAASNIAQALHDLPSPGILVSHNGFDPGNFGRNETYKQIFVVWVRPPIESGTSVGLSQILQLMFKGVPINQPGYPGIAYSIREYDGLVPGCYSMDPPKSAWRTDSSNGLDYYEITLKFPQWGFQ